MQQMVRRLADKFNAGCKPCKYDESCNVYVRDAALGFFEEDTHLQKTMFPHRVGSHEGDAAPSAVDLCLERQLLELLPESLGHASCGQVSLHTDQNLPSWFGLETG